MKRCPGITPLRASSMLLLSLVVQSAHAFDSVAGNPILDRVNIDVGTFFYGSGTMVTANGTVGQRGVPIDLEHQLGFKAASRFRLDGYWRFTAHQRFRVTYFTANRHASKTINDELHFRDDTYPIGATISANNRISMVEVSYEYDFLVRKNFMLGANIGIHNISFGLSLAGNAATASGTQQASLNQRVSVNGPLPLLGLAAIWRITPTFYFTADAQFLKVTINPYSGTLQDYAATAVWQPTKHFGFGAGYNLFRIRTDVNTTGFNGSLAWRYNGARVFVAASF